jgi:poly(3-hydroxybutyrate) depolymerase
MARTRAFLSMLVLIAAGAGCGAGSGGGTGTGGSAAGGSFGSGGATATGGTTATGGATGTGGAAATGGVTGTGGVTASGGSPGSGGRATTGTGGSAGRAGGSGGAGGAAAGTGGGSAGGAHGQGGAGGADATPSAGCGKTPTLKNSPTATANQNTLTVSGTSRQFLIRWPSNYDNSHPYRLILDFHGATGKDTDLAPSYFGLFNLSNNTTIFVAPSADGGIWNATTDTTFVDQILKTVEDDLCIDTSRVELEGFSQGGAMVAVLACSRPGVFRAAVGHSRGGLTAPTTCQPIPYLGSLGLSDVAGNSQATQTDPFARWDGCTIDSLPTAPTGGHVCTSYKGCMAGDPVIWCSFDGPHTASPTDAGQSSSWMPAEVWPFLSQF